MCGRYARYRDKESMYEAVQRILAEIRASYNISPTQQVPVARMMETPVVQLDNMRWGFFSTYSTQPIINARSETIETKPMFKEAFRTRRCCVPADGFFEWKRFDAKNKQPYYVTLASGGVMWFAGLWSPGDVESCAITTADAPKEFAHIHDRVPVILTAVDAKEWMDPATPVERLRELIAKPTPSFTLTPVAPLRGDGPGLIQAVAPMKPPGPEPTLFD